MYNNLNDKNNFGLLRLLAALFVLISHSFGILQKGLQQPALWYDGKHIILSDIGLYIFFTISGYLVTQSLFNSDSIRHYLWKRFVRIVPALVVVNIFCIVTGFFITNLTFKEYIFNTETWAYLIKNSSLVTNQYTLPGVYTNLHESSVNASIWTILVEVKFYVLLALGAQLIVSRNWLYLSCFILFIALRIFFEVNAITLKGLYLNTYFSFGTYFYLGSLFYCFRNHIRFKWFYANILLAAALITVSTTAEALVQAAFFAYCFVIIGTSKSVVNLRGCDLSYGIYLYAFPVQQLVLSYFGYSVNVWLHILISALLAALLALLSWTFIEKPFLKKKNAFGFSK